MKWIAIAGSWKTLAENLEKDVRTSVAEIIKSGNGIVSGGALGVDYFALDEAFKFDKTGEQIRILIPSTLDIFKTHYRKRAEEGVITSKQAEDLINQLESLKKVNTDSLIEGLDTVLDQTTYFNRITKIVEQADELYAFQVNKSAGTQDTIDKAHKKGIPVKVFSYTADS